MNAREFVNDVPFDDPLIVLDLLYTDRWEYRRERKMIYFPNMPPPYVRVQRVGMNGFYLYEVTPEVVLSLRRTGAVEGAPRLGYTEESEMTITDTGREIVRNTYDQLGVPFSFEAFPHRLRTEHWYRQGY